MSYFLIYFEKSNPNSSDYDGFPFVGKFSIPPEIFGGWVDVCYEGKKRRAALVTDWSRQAANDLFRKEGEGARRQLIDFLGERLKNKSVVACLAGYIEDNLGSLAGIERGNCLRAGQIAELLARRVDVGRCIEVVR
ncbi:hypothetical protein [Burkholderia pseudomultivorans]|uniref:hypothetical protein n=1 Tax=Burkholderia pseudomultivorans TaxID=1207504 RepID=UPI00188E11E8|nr:hypothetical protein [Burkholderia pseudomultivorans]MBF5010422.1 hypothetical protein [Burkholderia pseudomultivorans]